MYSHARTVHTLIAVGLLLGTRTVAAQIPAPDSPPNFRGMNLLKSSAVRAELELTAEQIDDLVALEAERQVIYSGPLGRLQQPTVEERKAAYAEFKRQLAELEKLALAVLVPHQQKRLEQIMLQQQVGAVRPRAGVTHPEMVKRLGLAEPQLETIRQGIIEAEKKYKERLGELIAEIAAAKDKARNEVLSNLTPEQRKQYEELVGKPIELNPLGDDLLIIER